MEAFKIMFINVLMLTLLVVPGFILGKVKKMEDAACLTAGNILTYVAMPMLVFEKLLETDLRTLSITAVITCLVFPIIMCVALVAVAFGVFRINESMEKKNRASRFCSVFPNCGFLGIPLAAAIFPNNPEITVYVSLFNVFSTLLLLTVGRALLSGDKKMLLSKTAFLSPVVFAIVIGTVCSLFGVGTKFPYAEVYASHLASLTTPLAMVVLGFELSKLDIKKMLSNAHLYLVAAVKLIISPIITVALLALLKFVLKLDVSYGLAVGLFISTAVSSPSSSPAMARVAGADSEHAATVAIGNTLLSVISLPILFIIFNLIFK